MTFTSTARLFLLWEQAVISSLSLTTQCLTNSVSVPTQHCSYYSDNKRASVVSYKIGYVFLICQWLRPWKTSFWLSNERLKNINMAEQDKKKEPYSKPVSHSLHILLFVWCRYWVSSEKSGLRSLRMAASVCWSGIGMLYGTNASGLAWTSQQYHFTLSLSLPLFLYVSLSLNKFLTHHLHHNHNSVEEKVQIRPKCRNMLAKPWLPASHAGSTTEIKCVKRREEKTTKQNPLHFIRLSLPFSLCV